MKRFFDALLVGLLISSLILIISVMLIIFLNTNGSSANSVGGENPSDWDIPYIAYYIAFGIGLLATINVFKSSKS